MKRTVIEEKQKTFCDICGCEISLFGAIESFEIRNLNSIRYTGKCGTLEINIQNNKGKKDVCINCLTYAINKALRDLYE